GGHGLGLAGPGAGDHEHRGQGRLDDGGLLLGGRRLLEQGGEGGGRVGRPLGGRSGAHSWSPSGCSGQLLRTAQWVQWALRRAVRAAPGTSRGPSRTRSSNQAGSSARVRAVWVRTAALFPPVPT